MDILTLGLFGFGGNSGIFAAMSKESPEFKKKYEERRAEQKTKPAKATILSSPASFGGNRDDVEEAKKKKVKTLLGN